MNAVWLPNRVLAGATGEVLDILAERVPLLKGKRQVDGRATAYVCRDATCSAPVTDPAALQALLG